ncbi:hypothetical protein IQ22_01872 [Pseudomonas duriflava]|uniref:Uncharacterized protein n=1 Tax=Pseudomonas duriflava TaxID=459528 RepID=A0A562QDW9_9PSED|nr:hypothetical protein [Pseudomonas duriflava]TWI54965.1 hypothetical protein IQ22_01872 [Pseudomonas duriflava]
MPSFNPSVSGLFNDNCDVQLSAVPESSNLVVLAVKDNDTGQSVTRLVSRLDIIDLQQLMLISSEVKRELNRLNKEYAAKH